MIKAWHFFALILVFLSCQDIKNKDSHTPYNIILILTDDQGYGDVGIHGNDIIQTPHLDKLGQQSVRFTNFHVGTTCAPTRSGIMSGLNCNRVGAWHTVMGRSFLSSRFPTMANYLQDDGYTTGIFGKWHLGDNYPFRPQDRGFDKVVIHGGGGVGQTPDYWNNDYFDDIYFEDGQPKQFSGYCTDIWFQEATKFIQNANSQEKPFFCFISTNSPHGPHHVAQSYIDLYKGKENVVNPNFYGQITNIDDNLGQLEEVLQQNGLQENTILIFLTDNGTAAGAQLDQQRFVTKGFNAGMRGKKGSEYEGGHRVPLFIRFPESLSIPIQEYSELTAYTDLLPTLLDFLSIKKQESYQFDGVSIKALLEKGQQPDLQERILVTDTQRKENVTKWKNASVMKNHWRLINNQELYDLSQDPEQRNNIIQNHPDLAKELSSAYESWWKDLEDDLQVVNYIEVGTEMENPSLLFCHDWHTEQLPPWHQRHVRAGLEDNGFWQVDIKRAGTYKIRLYRYPPYLKATFHSNLPKGDEVSGGTAYQEAIGQDWVSSKIKLRGQELVSDMPIDDMYFEFTLDLEAGPSSLQAWVKDKEGVERGAYFVEIELI